MNAASNALSGLPTARPEEVGLSSAGLRRMIDAMEREIAASRAPGMSMLIARHGKVAFAQSLGALRPDGPPMSADAIFRIYSMTKPIVSVAAMTLVEEGRLLISDPLAKYIPAFADMKVGVENGGKLDLVAAKRPITIQDLMRHTSGLTYGFTGARSGPEADLRGRRHEPRPDDRRTHGDAWPPCRCSISRARCGNIAFRPTCSAASSKSSLAAASANSCASEYSPRWA